jgi:hypothetical protein
MKGKTEKGTKDKVKCVSKRDERVRTQEHGKGRKQAICGEKASEWKQGRAVK